ncbi:alpha/beta hydrolase-fold protein [Sphingomonas sp.]|uniref:alpha/beta hydrolase n=2 Tax=unclassified Sphingomonas TaxID=196159 RepID=UPI00257AEA08|nr:alpha/beta hydrolase-fold protein [Sphingomonas sp.]
MSVPNSHRIRFTSSINGRDYLISVAVPLVPPPAQGYPVLYLFDPHFMFGTAVDAARMSAPEVMVVGVGYPLDDADFVSRTVNAVKDRLPDAFREMPQQTLAIWALRTHDLTLPATAEDRRRGTAAGVAALAASLSGGLDTFLDVVDREVKPRVAAVAPVDASRAALFGHSLGGLAVLHALFTRPESFGHFIAASPSIWAAPALWTEETAFGQRIASAPHAPAVMLAVGGREQDRVGASSKMIDNMREMARRLRAIERAGPPMQVVDVVFADEDHGSVQQASVSRAIDFAFRGARR